MEPKNHQCLGEKPPTNSAPIYICKCLKTSEKPVPKPGKLSRHGLKEGSPNDAHDTGPPSCSQSGSVGSRMANRLPALPSWCQTGNLQQNHEGKYPAALPNATTSSYKRPHGKYS